MMIALSSRYSVLAALFLTIASGCQNMNHTEYGALVGSGLGAVVGSAIGRHNGDRGAGALIGAATGAVAGGLVGNAEDARIERDAALAHAHFTEQAHQADLLALTNYDLIKMTHNGVGDEVIINSVATRGGRFDLSPDAVINLKNSGVSDRVIIAVQKAGQSAAAPSISQVSATTVVPPARSVVVVEPTPRPRDVVVVEPPRPRINVSIGSPRPRHHHHHHWW